MSNYATLKSAIQQVIKTNGNNEITGALLQQSLLSMINSLGANYQYAGIATPSTNPGTPDQNVFYIAGTAGIYSNFNNINVSEQVAILSYNGSWTKTNTGIQFVNFSQDPNTGRVSITIGGTSEDVIGIDGYNQLIGEIGLSTIVPYKFVQHLVDTAVQSSSGNRYSLLFRVKPGYKLTAICDWGLGIFANVYSDENTALIDPTGAALQTIQDAYTRQGFSGEITVDGILRIGTTKADNSAFTAEDIANFLNAISFSLLDENSLYNYFTKKINDVSAHPYKFVQHLVDTAVQSSDGNRFSILFNVPSGLKIIAKSDFGSGIFASTWASESLALIGSSDDVLQNIQLSYTKNTIESDITASGVLRIGTRKTDNSAFTQQDVQNFLDSLIFYIGIKDTSEQYISKFSIRNKIDIDKKVSSLSWMSIFTNGVINANNITKKIEIPDILVFDENGEHLIGAQQISYNWGENARERFALVVSDDYSTVNMVEWVDITNQSKLIAFIKRNSSTDTNVRRFYGGASYTLFSIDGINVENSVSDIQNTIIPLEKKTEIAACNYGPIRHDIYGYTSLSGIRYSIGFDVVVGDVVRVILTNPNFYIDVNVWDTWQNAVIAPSAGDHCYQLVSGDSWVDANKLITGTIVHDGVMIFRFKKTDNSAFTDADIELVNSNIQFEILGNVVGGLSNVETKVNELSGKRELYIGELYQNTTYRVAMRDIVCLPYRGVSVHLEIPSNIKVVFRSGATDAVNIEGGWVLPGGTYKFPDGSIFYQLYFADKDNPNSTPIYVDTIKQMVASGKIKITYDSKDLVNIFERNTEPIKMSNAAARALVLPMDNNNGHELALFGHISDLHGDAIRAKNFFELMRKINVDGAFVTGDTVAYKFSDDCNFLIDFVNKYNVKTFNVIGNHDVSYLNGSISDIFNRYIQPFVAQGGYLKQADTPATDTYYYVDLDAKKIRIIVPNYFVITPGGGLEYPRLSQSQITWFINTLLSTPQNYGIIVLLHGQEKWMSAAVSGYEKFFQSEQISNPISIQRGDGIISKIIDAFISRSVINTSFTEPNVSNTETETVMVSADFSGVADGVEFLFFAAGHSHRDLVGYVPNTVNKQLMLDIVCGICYYGTSYPEYANESDLSRREFGPSQDAINIYGVDRTKGTIKIVRIGANVDVNMNIRDYMVIPYRD